MSIKINFDATLNPEEPTLVLAKRNGKKMGALDAHGIVVKGAMTDANEIQFEMYKYQSDGETLTNLWYSVIDFRLIWCKEWDKWFELTVDLDETTETRKTIACTQLGDAELSQILLFDIHINDEDDILRDDYEIPTVLYNPEHPEASLLNRITEHAPHYYIRHVDASIMNIQRTFTFDSESIKDAFNEIAEEIECLFVLPSDSDEDGNINRAIDVYDLDSVCNTCGHRGDFTGKCPECGSTDINEGYGEDTTIFISAEELASEIQFGTDTDSVKNCFKLEGGDDLMTATIRNCNPNGSDRIWYITEQSKADMSDELLQGLADYDELYEYYQSDYIAEIPDEIIEEYNELVTKYREYSEDIEYIPSEIVGYPALMEAYYNTIDFSLYLQSTLMPDASIDDTTAEEQASYLTRGNLNPVAVADVSNISTSTANNAVLAMAKVIVDSRYQVKVNEGELGSGQQWTGNFKVTNYSDDEDTAISSTITITITDDYEEYLYQMIEKELNNDEVNDMSITYLFTQMTYDEFCAELKKYCLDSLNMFWNAGQACLDILIEQGVADKATWGSEVAGAESNLYERLYLPYYEKQEAIEAEIKLREDEIAIILGTYDEDGTQDEYGLQTYLILERNAIQDTLDFEGYLGADLWLEFSAFRREDKYSNSNYISDGLDNAELFSRAWEFFEKAQEEIYKSAELQHSISTSLKNLLVIDKFKPLIDYFECGNWLRVRTDDSVYKLRLIEYEIDYDSIDSISVDYSDVMKTLDGISDKQSLISKMGSISSSYDTVEHQAYQGSKANGTLEGWSLWGLDVDNVKLVQSADNETQSWDEHGMLFRKYDPVTETYSDEQLKIIHSTMVITDDNWATVKTAVGGFYYYDPANDYQLTYAYGVNGEVIVGQLILGEQLGIYNEAGTLTFNADGLTITDGSDTVFHVDTKGNAYFAGEIEAIKGHIGNWIIGTDKIYNDLDVYDATAVMQAPNPNMTWVFACGGSTHDNYSDCPFRVSKAGLLYAEGGKIAQWEFGGHYIRGGSEELGTTAIMQVPHESASDTRYWVFAAGGYHHDDHGDCRFRVGSDGEVYANYLTCGETTGSKAKLDDGKIQFYHDNVLLGGVYSMSRHEDETVYYGTYIGTDTNGKFLSIGTSTGTSSNTVLLINDGINPNGYTEDAIFEGTTRFRDDVHMGSNYLYFGSNDDQRLAIFNPGIGSNGWFFGRGGLAAGTTYYSNYALSVYGDGYASGAFYEGSDVTLKTDIKPLEEDILDNITPVEYRFKDDDQQRIHFGVTYQNVCEALESCGIIPEETAIVSKAINGETGEETGAVAYNELIGLLIYEVQKLKSEIQEIRST